MLASRCSPRSLCISFFFNDTATTEIYTLSLHDALPIYLQLWFELQCSTQGPRDQAQLLGALELLRSEEHTSELQSRQYLVCRLLLEKKKQTTIEIPFCYRGRPRRSIFCPAGGSSSASAH